MSADATTPPTSGQPSNEVWLQLDWSALDDIPLKTTNRFLAQGLGDDVALWFGQVAPTVDVAVPGMLAPDRTLRVEPVARLMMPKKIARVLLAVLQANLDDDREGEQ